VLLRWLFLSALVVAAVLLLLQATAPNREDRHARRARRALREIVRRSRHRGAEGKKLVAEARLVVSGLEKLNARAAEIRRFLGSRELDALARRQLEEYLSEIEALLEGGAALLERLAAELWASEPLDLPAAAARLSRARMGLIKALKSPAEKEGVN